MKESSIEKRFVQLCRRHGMRVIKMTAMFEMGIPDRLVLLEGYAGFAEIKRPGQYPSTVQEAYIKKLKREGCFVEIVSHPNDIVTWIMKFHSHIQNMKRSESIQLP